MIEDYSRKVFYYETDRMGIVHHSNYIRWFEEARVFYLNEVGLNYNNLENMGIWLPVLSSCCNYKSFLKYDESFSIHVDITEYNGFRIRLDYTVTKSDGTVAATGYTTHCFTNPEMKILRINKKYPEIHSAFLALKKDEQ